MASPFLRNQSPAEGDTSIPLDTDIWFEIADSDSAIDGYSIAVTVDGQIAWQNDTYQAGFNVTRWSISDGYRFFINPDCNFQSGEVIIGVYAEDADSNILDAYYSFELDRINIFEDDFNDGTLSLESTPRNGIITESGGNVNLSINTGVNGDYYTNINNAPFAHVAANYIREDTRELIYTAELVSWSAVDSNVAGGFNLFDGENPSQNAYYFEFNQFTNSIVLRYFENGGTNTFGISATIPDPSVTPTQMRIRWNIREDLLTFELSTDGGCTWDEYGTRTPTFTPDRIGFYVKNYSSIQAVSASWNFLTIDEEKIVDVNKSLMASGFTEEIEFPDNIGTTHDNRHTFPQNTPTLNTTNEIEKSSGFVEEIEWPDTGGDIKHTFPQKAEGKSQRLVGTGLQDGAIVLHGTADIKAESQTTDDEGHPHFVGRQAYVSFFYDGILDPWNDPTNTNHTGYARDGYKYTNGILDAGPVLAPWANETTSDDRSSRSDFPIKALIVGTLSEIVIFDMDGYESDGYANVWMRFRYGSGSDYYQIGASDGRYINDVMFKDGVLIAVSGQTTIGGLKIIDFRAEGQDFFSLIRSDDDWIGVTGRDITDRNTTGNHTTTGGTNARIASEYPESVSAIFLPRPTPGDYDEWYAIAGEDNVSLVCRTNISGNKTTVAGLFEAQGNTNGTARRILFDKSNILWFSIDNKLHRNIYDYKNFYIYAQTNNTVGQPNMVVELPSDITCLADGPGYMYVGTTKGVYVVQKGDMSFHLAYTIKNGGGGGKNNIPLVGELLIGNNPEIKDIRSFTSNSVIGEIGFLSVAISYTANLSGGTTLIRIFDEIAIKSQEYPQIAEDGAYFAEMIII